MGRFVAICWGTCAVLLLAGCAGIKPAPTVIHEPVVVTKRVYVPITPALTAKRAIPEPRNRSGRELLRVTRTRKTDLQLCYGKLDSIGLIQGTAATDFGPFTPVTP